MLIFSCDISTKITDITSTLNAKGEWYVVRLNQADETHDFINVSHLIKENLHTEKLSGY